MLYLPIVLALVGGLPEPWFADPILPPDVARDEVRRWVDARLVPTPPAEGRAGDDRAVHLWEDRRAAVREALLDVTGLRGAWPPTWPLDVRVKQILRREGYTIEKLTYESWPGMAVPALLYLPDRIPPGKAPGIVSISGHHYRASKAADYVQARNVNLVRRGCVVLSYDYMNCFERHTGGDGDGLDPVADGGGNDHGITAFSFSERCPTTLEILDARRALDVLCGRPEVDAGRLGFTGESGGSNSTYWVAALDDRVRLSVPVCSVSTFDYWIDKDRNWDWHQRPRDRDGSPTSACCWPSTPRGRRSSSPRGAGPTTWSSPGRRPSAPTGGHGGSTPSTARRTRSLTSSPPPGTAIRRTSGSSSTRGSSGNCSARRAASRAT